jgi:hypothetical protein
MPQNSSPIFRVPLIYEFLVVNRIFRNDFFTFSYSFFGVPKWRFYSRGEQILERSIKWFQKTSLLSDVSRKRNDNSVKCRAIIIGTVVNAIWTLSRAAYNTIFHVFHDIPDSHNPILHIIILESMVSNPIKLQLSVLPKCGYVYSMAAFGLRGACVSLCLEIQSLVELNSEPLAGTTFGCSFSKG